VHDESYGTPRRHVAAVLDAGEDCILNIDVQGAAALREMGIEPALFVFLLPPDNETLAARLAERGTADGADFRVRVENAQAEMARVDEFDARVVNDELDRTVTEVRGLIEKKRESAKER
jgi:guanylate kinase